MKSGTIITIVVVALLALVGFMGCNGYNGLVQQDEVVKKAWNNVQAEYQNRADLVPNLVNTVKGAANFEQETLTKVIEARSRATAIQLNADQLTPENLAKFQQAQTELSGALSRLLVTIERYPDLKAVQGFQDLQRQLEGIENNIKNSRKTFNEAVNGYNVKVRSFPMNLLAGMFGFAAKEGFQAEPGSDKAPEVKF
ncbi:MAG TPA: LemA family protein [Lacibacter sp.]|nr:LemA family protein [Lacibacter sp.]HMO89482.1 LemA family protein [Lacibacter sp.]